MPFIRAPLVAPGDDITSRQLRGLARAFNSRLRSGIGDSAWRLFWYHLNLWRQLRNPDETGFLFPPQAEAFDIYHHVDPETSKILYPTAAPGDPEGANLANFMAAFVFGSPSLYPEDLRLNDVPLWLESGNAATPEELWTLGKYQRGAYDPDTGAQIVPAFTAAQEVFRITAHAWSPHGKSYGGYLPTPDRIVTGYPIEGGTDCGDDESNGWGIPNLARKFTATRAGVTEPSGHHATAGTATIDGETRLTLTYPGACPCNTLAAAAGHLQSIYRGPLAYYVAILTDAGTCDVTWDRLPVQDWVEGPYEGPAELAHTEGGQLARVLSRFAADLRGTPAQRTPDSFDIEAVAFDFQAFMSRQYALAPARGQKVDAGHILAIYPRASWTGNQAAGTVAPWEQNGSTEYAVRSGFVLAGMFAKASGLASAATIGVYDGTRRLRTLSLSPDADGNAAALYWLPAAKTPAALQVRLETAAEFTSDAGTIEFEAAELLDYKPNTWDAYLVARLGATTSSGTAVDGSGLDCENARDISRTLFRSGCITGQGPAGVRPLEEAINTNPVYDAGRRWTREQVRFVNRRQFAGYEVDAQGRSVLYLRRFAYGMSNTRVDMLSEIAPPLDPLQSGNLEEGTVYTVRAPAGGFVTYHGATYRDGQQFTATAETDFQPIGDGAVYQFDGIRHTAPKGGTSNEWVLWLDLKRYSTSGSSLWKAPAYADYFPVCDRCQFQNGQAPFPFRAHVTFGEHVDIDPDTLLPHRTGMRIQASMFAPELPSGLRYAMGTNSTYASDDFLKSCQVYQTPYEVESCTVDNWQADQVVKVVLKTRLQTHPSAPATWSRTPPTWNSNATEPAAVSALRAEVSGTGGYRTDDNALREYAVHTANAQYQCECAVDAGDEAAYSEGMTDVPHGACYPSFCFVHLIGEPYADDNNTSEPHDTRALFDAFAQMETILRATCEGFVDGRTSLAKICENNGDGGLYDFTFESLCLQAFGGRWLTTLTEENRPDKPEGFGPIPNTEMAAEIFNQLAAASNLLTEARVDVPITLRQRVNNYVGNHTTGADNGGPCGATMVAFGRGGFTSTVLTGTWEGLPFDPFDPTAHGWIEDTSATGSAGAGPDFTCNGSAYGILSARTATDYAFNVGDTRYLSALSPEARGLFIAGSAGAACVYTDTIITYRAEAVGIGDAATCDGSPFYASGSYWRFVDSGSETSECVMLTSGTLDPGTPPPGDYGLFRTGTAPECPYGSARFQTIVPLSSQAGFLRVPLVDDDANP